MTATPSRGPEVPAVRVKTVDRTMMAIGVALVVCICVFAFIASIVMNKKKEKSFKFDKPANNDTQATPDGSQPHPAGPAPAPNPDNPLGGIWVPDNVRLAECDITSRVTSRSSANWLQDKRMVGAADFLGTDIAMRGDYIAFTKKNDSLVVLHLDPSRNQTHREIPFSSLKSIIDPERFFVLRAPKGAKPVFLRHLGPMGVKIAIIDDKVYAAKALDKPMS
eukprot:jgi/Mesvir1/22169/Mv18771-RA.1